MLSNNKYLQDLNVRKIIKELLKNYKLMMVFKNYFQIILLKFRMYILKLALMKITKKQFIFIL
jgi:hypothetical protein